MTFLEKLRNITLNNEEAMLLYGVSRRDETLKAYRWDKQPLLTIVRKLKRFYT